MNSIQYAQGAQMMQSIFGKPAVEEMTGSLRSRIKKIKNKGYVALVKTGFFSKWKPLGWAFFNEQPEKGYTQGRASTKHCTYSQNYGDALRLIEDFEQYRGAGITIW